MKILIFGDTESRFHLLNDILSNSDIEIGFCLGNLGYYTESTPINRYLRSKIRNNVQESIDFNNNVGAFNKVIYSLYGSLDDPFIPASEFKIRNLFPIWRGIIDFAAHNSDYSEIKNVKIAMLSGYYNQYGFSLENKKRLKMKRERKSNALCGNDIKYFNNMKADIMFMHENALDIISPETGSPQISSLINKLGVKHVFTGHARKHEVFLLEKYEGYNDVEYHSLPPLVEGYYILDLFDSELEYIENNIKE